MKENGFLNLTRPLVVVTGSYVVGIAWGGAWMGGSLAALGVAALLVLLALGAVVRRHLSLLAAVLLIAAGAAGAVSFLLSAGPPSGNILNYSGYPLYVEGVVGEEPLQMEDHTAYEIRVETVENRQGRFPMAGKLLVRVYGGEEEPYWFGEKLRLRGVIEEARGRRNPGGFDYRFYLCTRGISGIMYLKPYQVHRLEAGGTDRLQGSALLLRSRLVEGIGGGLPAPCAQLLAAILFGQRHLLPESVQESFRESGVSHLLAVSGLHVGLVAALFLGFCRRIRLRGRLPLAVAVVVIFGYAYLTGMRPPALRAAVMFSMASGALLLDRENDLPTAVAVAALLTLVFNPLHLFSAGFQLSYAATLAIIYGSPPLVALLGRLKLPPYPSSLLAVTLAAQVGVLPICAVHFQHIPLGALGFNLLLLPVMAPVVGLGLTAALVQLFSPMLAGPLFLGVRLLLEYILAVTGFSRVAAFYLPVCTPRLLTVLLYYAVLVLALFYYYRQTGDTGCRRRRLLGLPVFLLVFAVVLAWGGRLPSFPWQQRLTVTFIDVGQGAAALIESGRGRILIDCGGEPPYFGADPGMIGEKVLLPFLRYRGVGALDLVVITHPHEDHFGGLGPLLESLPVKSLWISPQPGSSPYYMELLAEALSRGIPLTAVQEGQKCSCYGLTLEVLAPPSPLHSGTGSDENNNSIVLRLLHPRAKFLFCGDIEQAAVQDLLRRRRGGLEATVLLVPHHGGPLPDLPRLIEAVGPQLAVIQVGTGNPFGHPHPSTLEALRRAGVTIFRSDHHGAVIVDVNRGGLAVETVQKPAPSVSSAW